MAVCLPCQARRRLFSTTSTAHSAAAPIRSSQVAQTQPHPAARSLPPTCRLVRARVSALPVPAAEAASALSSLQSAVRRRRLYGRAPAAEAAYGTRKRHRAGQAGLRPPFLTSMLRLSTILQPTEV